ncbi:hypothetical protein F5Y09DRAFT_314748 [Xylaria sp. FL1042]|nr:hypothetical protein F5Y09DRAFT_314748 [Xylaria sp. FL1042]
MKSSRTCLRCWQPVLILAFKLLVLLIVLNYLLTIYILPCFFSYLLWPVYFILVCIIIALFVLFLSWPIWYNEKSPEKHTHFRLKILTEKLSQEL